MKQLAAFLFFTITFLGQIFGQTQPDYRVILEEQTIPNLPGLQAYVIGESGGKWLVIGGRKDGLHRRQPFAAFDVAGGNEKIHVIDPVSKTVWSKPLAGLPTGLVEQLQSTNMEFRQSGNTLFIMGGYGFSATEGDHITYPFLTAVNVPGAISAVVNGTDLQPHFRQIEDARMQVTGGYLDKLGDYFYLAGGQNFIGRYNPMGPTHGPGFFQEYTDEIRRFKISDDGTTLALTDFSAWHDSLNLHRRDYNMVPQVFPNGKRGFTMFSGVFQHTVDLPWLNTVDLDSTGFLVKNGFEQLLNQYHTAHLPMFDSAKNQMHTLFFGGISRFRVDDVTGLLIDDTDVPFVRTISMITRFSDGQMKEVKIGEMPSLMGSSAEFVAAEIPAFDDGILNLDEISGDTVFVGHILGGIKSSQPNIFFINTGAESEASNRLYKVSLVRNYSSAVPPVSPENGSKLTIVPNPFRNDFEIEFEVFQPKKIEIRVFDNTGKQVLRFPEKEFAGGKHRVGASLAWFPVGNYTVVLVENGRQVAAERVVKF